MKVIHYRVFILSIVLFAVACTSYTTIDPFVDESVEGPYTTIEGTISYQDLEGGFWALTGDDGTHYDPVNLPERFQSEGLAVRAEVVTREDMGSIRMFGTIVEIHRIEKRK